MEKPRGTGTNARCETSSLLVKVFSATELATPSLIAMALTVVVALRVMAALYWVLLRICEG